MAEIMWTYSLTALVLLLFHCLTQLFFKLQHVIILNICVLSTVDINAFVHKGKMML